MGCIAACEDLSSVRAMEAGLRQADRLATLGRMAANIAHEVRNPLASLSGAVEALTCSGRSIIRWSDLSCWGDFHPNSCSCSCTCSCYCYWQCAPR